MSKQDVIASLKAQIDSIQAVGCSGNGMFEQGFDDNRKCGAAGKPPRFINSSKPEENDDVPKHRDPNAAFKKIIAMVNVSDRSEHSIRDRLAHEGYEERAIDESVQRAKGYGFIDDIRFSENLVRSRIAQGKGSAGIVRELAEHGIDAESVPGWPYEYPLSSEEELDRALGMLKRNPPRSKNLREGAYRKLMFKGYPSSVCSSAARQWAEHQVDAESF